MFEVEIDMVVSDTLKAVEIYENVFNLEDVTSTNLERGLNEAIFTIHGTRFHILDENPEYDLTAPEEGKDKSVWFNITVEDINKVYDKAINAGFEEVQPITKMEDMGVSNAVFSDPFGHVWMIHQVHHKVSFEKRMEIMDKKIEEES